MEHLMEIRMEAHFHEKHKIKGAVVVMDKYARQDFNEVRDDGKNCTEREVDPASSVRVRSEPNHNHDVSMDIQKDIESESNSYVIKKTGELLSIETLSASFALQILDDSSQVENQQLMKQDQNFDISKL